MPEPSTSQESGYVYCVWCLRSHAPPVAVTVNDGCPNQPDLMAALDRSLSACNEREDHDA